MWQKTSLQLKAGESSEVRAVRGRGEQMWPAGARMLLAQGQGAQGKAVWIQEQTHTLDAAHGLKKLQLQATP